MELVKSWAKPLRDFFICRHASRVNKLRIYLILLIIGVVRLAAYLYWECPDGQKSFKIYTESYKICAYALRHTYIGVALRAEINQKLNSKLIALRAEIRSYAYGILILGVALRARNLTKSIQNQTESGRSPCGTSFISRHASRGNYAKFISKLNKIYLDVRLRRTYFIFNV